MNVRWLLTVLVGAWSLLAAVPAANAADEIPAPQVQRITAAAPAQPRVPPARPRRVLVWVTPAHLMPQDPHKGYCIPYGTCAITTLGRKTGAFEPVVSDDLAQFLPENLNRFDAVVLNNSSGAWITPTAADLAKPAFQALGPDAAAVEAALRRAFLDFVQRGGGVVAYHFAIGANRQWPEFRELLGGTFIGHPWNEEVGVTVEEPGHPLVAAFQGKDFRITDEIFHYGPPYDRSRVRVLLSLDPERTNMGVKWIERTDGDFALAWVKTYGQGRIFYTSFGHRTELYWYPPMLQFYLDAIQFAVGDLAAPTAPRADRPERRTPGPTPAGVREEKLRTNQVALPTAAQRQAIEAAAPSQAARPAKPRKVLVWGHPWTHGPNPFAEAALEILGRKSGAFEATLSDDPRLLLGDRLPRFDAVVLNNLHERDPFLPERFGSLTAEQQAAARQFDAAVKASLLEFVRGGKGVVGIHAATAALQNWPEYGELMGGFYGGHIDQEVVIAAEDPTHPLTACLEGKRWRIRDEIYIPREPFSRDRLRVLLALDLARMADPGKRADRDYAVSWIHEFGRGRVFYTTLGHAAETYANPVFLRHVLAGVQYALGDLPAPADPLPKALAASVGSAEASGLEPGFVSLFNGTNLVGWSGDARIWSVRDGAITGQSTPDVRVAENNFLIWEGGEPAEFELRLQFKLVGGNSGIYFHAQPRAPGAKGEALVGPQADFSADHRWTGVLMEYTRREILAERGQEVVIDAQGQKRVTGSTGDPAELLKAVKSEDWNDYRVVVGPETVLLEINGVTMCRVTDRDPRRARSGVLALQVHVGPPMTVQFRKIRWKR